MLAETDDKLETKKVEHSKIVKEMAQMEEQMQDVSQAIKEKDALIGEQNKLLNQEKEA